MEYQGGLRETHPSGGAAYSSARVDSRGGGVHATGAAWASVHVGHVGHHLS